MKSYKKIRIDIAVPPYSGHLYPILELIKPLLNNEKYDICNALYKGNCKRRKLYGTRRRRKRVFEKSNEAVIYTV